MKITICPAAPPKPGPGTGHTAQMIILDMKYKHYEISTIIYNPRWSPAAGGI